MPIYSAASEYGMISSVHNFTFLPPAQECLVTEITGICIVLDVQQGPHPPEQGSAPGGPLPQMKIMSLLCHNGICVVLDMQQGPHPPGQGSVPGDPLLQMQIDITFVSQWYMLKNVLKRRKECGTYLATARRRR